MARTRGSGPIAVALAVGSIAALSGEQLRRILRAREQGSHWPPPTGHMPPSPTRRVLVVGDSTGAGVGCESPAESVAGRLAEDFAQVEVQNAAVSGATVADVVNHVRDLTPGSGFDLVLVFAGGNDVIRRTRRADLRRSVRELLDALHGRGGPILWMGMANVGLAPAFLPPLSWWLTCRTRRVSRLLAEELALGGAHFVDFFHERAVDPFSAEPDWYYAGDGVHPSAQAYEYCYQRMKPLILKALSIPSERRYPGYPAARGSRDCQAPHSPTGWPTRRLLEPPAHPSVKEGLIYPPC